MKNTDKISEIFNLISKKTGKERLNLKKYVIMSQAPPQVNNRFSVAPMPAYDPLLEDDEARVIDPNTLVKNLKSTKLELREKIFVDKPVHKQLEITLEEKQGINTTSALQRQMTAGLTGGQIQGGYFGGQAE